MTEDWDNYTILVHSLKSGLYNIGASIAGDKAKALEMAGKGNDVDYIVENHSDFMLFYKNICDAVRIVLEENSRGIVSDVKEGKESEIELNSSIEFRGSINDDDSQLLQEMIHSINIFIDELEVDKAISVIDNMNVLSMDETSKKILADVRASLDMFNMERAKELITQINI